MAEGNGKSIDGMATPPNESAKFKIGGRVLVVPALTLWDLELSRDEIQSLTPEMQWSTYATTVVKIIARKLNEDNTTPYAEALLRSCSIEEAMAKAVEFNELLRVSGFEMGEVVAATGTSGTGTSTESQQNSPSPSDSQTSS
jgi:hypothetical protein